MTPSDAILAALSKGPLPWPELLADGWGLARRELALLYRAPKRRRGAW